MIRSHMAVVWGSSPSQNQGVVRQIANLQAEGDVIVALSRIVPRGQLHRVDIEGRVEFFCHPESWPGHRFVRVQVYRGKDADLFAQTALEAIVDE